MTFPETAWFLGQESCGLRNFRVDLGSLMLESISDESGIAPLPFGAVAQAVDLPRRMGRVRLEDRMKPIQTRYKGYHFRSRLEARWAVCFDALGIPWEYEAEGFEGDGERYLPDFRLWGNQYAEVKRIYNDEENHSVAIMLPWMRKCLRFAEFDERGLVMLFGPPDVKAYCVWSAHGEDDHAFIDLGMSAAKGRTWLIDEMSELSDTGGWWERAIERARGMRFDGTDAPVIPVSKAA